MGNVTFFAAVLAAVTLLGPLSSQSQALVVTHDTLGVIFSDDVEGEGVDNAMVAEIGTWVPHDSTQRPDTTIPNLITGDSSSYEYGGGPTAAFDGDNYVHRDRRSGTHEISAKFDLSGQTYSLHRHGCA